MIFLAMCVCSMQFAYFQVPFESENITICDVINSQSRGFDVCAIELIDVPINAKKNNTNEARANISFVSLGMLGKFGFLIKTSDLK